MDNCEISVKEPTYSNSVPTWYKKKAKRRRKEICLDLLARKLEETVTDKTWAFQYDPQTTCQSLQLERPRSLETEESVDIKITMLMTDLVLQCQRNFEFLPPK
jgi:hypothetical protein